MKKTSSASGSDEALPSQLNEEVNTSVKTPEVSHHYHAAGAGAGLGADSNVSTIATASRCWENLQGRVFSRREIKRERKSTYPLAPP